jgi:ribosomal protein S12 methylthiotransferase
MPARGRRPATAVARSAAEAPEIDGLVRVEHAAGAAPGAFVPVTITGADAHDLVARPRVALP